MTRKLRTFCILFLSTMFAVVLSVYPTAMHTSGIVRAAELPDLVVTSVSWSPAQPFSGDSVRFSAVVKNQGTVATPAGTVIGGIFKVDGSNVVYTDTYNSALAADASVTVTASGGGSLGDGIWVAQEGNHTIGFLVDDINRIPESVENNNDFTNSSTLTIAQRPGPDLVISNITWSPEALQVGNQVTFSAVLKNQGRDPAPNGAAVQFKVGSQVISTVTSSSSLNAGQSVTVAATQKWTVANGSSSVQAIADPNNQVTEGIENNNTRALTLSVGQRVTMNARSADAFVDSIGVNVHLSYYDTPYGDYTGIVKPRLQESGIRNIRDGAYLTQTDVTNKFKDLATIGIKTNLLVSEPDPNRELEVVKQAAPAVVSVEGPNEPDLFSLTQFPDGTRSYQNTLYSLIKGDPATQSLPVIATSPVREGNAQVLGPVSCDIGNTHPYAGGLLPDRSLANGIAAAKVVCPNKPVWATEIGYNNAVFNTSGQPGVSEQAGAKYIARTYLETFRNGIARTFVYEFIDEFDDPNQQNPEARFGIVRRDGTPKPAFTAVKNMISLLKEPGASFTPGSLGYTISGNTTDLRQLLLQKQDGTYYLVLWVNGTSYDLSSKQDVAVATQSVTLTFDQAITQGKTYQPVQSTTALTTYGTTNSVTLNVPDEPLVLEFKGGQGIDGRYTLKSRNSGLLLDNYAYGGAGTKQVQWTATGGANQKWDVVSVGGGYYKVTSVSNGLALDITGGSTSQGAAVVIQPYSGANSQLWQFLNLGNGYYQIKNKQSGYVLDVNGASTAVGAAVIQWPANGGNNQQWQLGVTS